MKIFRLLKRLLRSYWPRGLFRFPSFRFYKREFEIWSEGGQTMEGKFGAAKLGTGSGFTFRQAVDDHVSNVTKNREYYRLAKNGKDWHFYGCRLYDNPSDARKSFE